MTKRGGAGFNGERGAKKPLERKEQGGPALREGGSGGGEQRQVEGDPDEGTKSKEKGEGEGSGRETEEMGGPPQEGANAQRGDVCRRGSGKREEKAGADRPGREGEGR